MHITIDNLDGRGAIDYSAAILADTPLRIERVLNHPSRCTGSLLFGGNFMLGADPGLTLPLRHARVRIIRPIRELDSLTSRNRVRLIVAPRYGVVHPLLRDFNLVLPELGILKEIHECFEYVVKIALQA